MQYTLNTRRLCLTAFLVTLAAAPLRPAHAQSEYFLRDDFVFHFTATVGAPVLRETTARQFVHAWVREPGHNVSAVEPAQGPIFDNFGTDKLFGLSPRLAPAGPLLFNYRRDMTPVSVPIGVLTTSMVPGMAIALNAVLPPPISSAEAHSQVEYTSATPTSATGFIQSNGVETPVGAGTAKSYAYSSFTVRTGRIGKGGVIKWSPRMSTTAFGGGPVGAGIPGVEPTITVFTDPLFIEAFDPDTGESLSSMLLSAQYTPLAGNSQFQWDSATGNFQLNAGGVDTDALFVLDLPGDYTTQKGLLLIRVDDGRISAIEQNGIFTGVALPPVGAPAVFGTQLSIMDIDYDIPLNGSNLRVALTGYNGAIGASVPEPGPLAFGGVALFTVVMFQRSRRVKTRRQAITVS